MAKFCEKCGAPLGENSKFCVTCGTPVSSAAAAVRRSSKKPVLIAAACAVPFIAALILILVLRPGGEKAPSGAVAGLFGTGTTGSAEIHATETGGTVVIPESVLGTDQLLDPITRAMPVANSKTDAVSENALLGTWNIMSSYIGWTGSGSTSGSFYKFSSDGTFWRAHLYQYQSSYITYGYYYNYYNTYTSGVYQFQTQGKWRVKGGVIEFYDAATSSKYGNNWNDLNAKPDGAWQMLGDWSEEFEFLSGDRLRLRGDDSDTILKWDGDGAHNTPLPDIEIPAVAWPTRALSPDMPVLGTNGRIRKTWIADYEDDIPPIYEETNIVIDRMSEADIDSCFDALRAAGWYVDQNDYPPARKGFYTVKISFSSPDEIHIYSKRTPEGVWPLLWAPASVVMPDGAQIIGTVDLNWSRGDYSHSEYFLLDHVDDAEVSAFAAKLTAAGFRKSDSEWEDWLYYKYLQLDGELFRVSVDLRHRYGDISEFGYYFRYYDEGIWPDIWSSAGLPAPEGYTHICESFRIGEEYGWTDTWESYSTYSASPYFIGMSQSDVDSYLNKLQTMGFTKYEIWDGEYEYAAYLRIDGKIFRVDISQRDNSEIIELDYYFRYYEDGIWPDFWESAGIFPPVNTGIAGDLDMTYWDDSRYNSYRVVFKDADANDYFRKLLASGYTQEDEWGDTVYTKECVIRGERYRVKVQDEGNAVVTELYYSFSPVYD